MANKITTVLDLDGSKFGKGIKQTIDQVKQADGAINKLKAGWTGVLASFKASPASVGVAAGAVAAFTGKAIGDASKLEESINAVNVAYRGGAEAVRALGEESARSVGLSQSAFNELAVSLSGFTEQIAGGQFGAPRVLDDLTKRIADFASVMNLDVAEAAAVFRSALAGETEPIRRFGKDLSAATVEQYALAKGLVSSRGEMTEAIKVQARYGLLMEQTADTAGDFERTQDSLANQQRILAAQVENISASFGAKLIPVVSEAAETVNNLITVYDELVSRGEGAGKDGESFVGRFWKTADAHGLGGVVKGLEDLAKATDWLRRQVETTETATVDFADAVKAESVALARQREATADAADEMVDLGDKTTNRIKVGDIHTAIIEGEARALSEARERANEYAEALDETNRRNLEAIDKHNRLIDAQRGVDSAARGLDEALAEQNRLLTEGTVSAEEKARALDDIRRAEDEAAAAARELAEAQADQERLLRESIATDEDKARALREVEDAMRAVEDAHLSQREAALGLQEAEAALEDAKRRREDLLATGPASFDDEGISEEERGRRSRRAVEDHTRAVEDANRSITRAELNLERARLRVDDANRKAEESTQDLSDTQAEQERILREGIATDAEKAASQRRVDDAQRKLQEATEGVEGAQRSYQELLRDSIPTDDEKEAAQRRVEEAIRRLGQAAIEESSAVAAYQGAIEGSTGALALQRQELDNLIAKFPELRAELQPTIDLMNQLIGVHPNGPPAGVAVPSGGGLPVFRFDSGGVVPGPRGKPQLVVAEGGETILPTHKQRIPLAAGGDEYHVHVHAGAVVTEQQMGRLVNQWLTTFKRNGGRIGFNN